MRMPLVCRSPSSLVTRAVLMLLRCTLTATSFIERSRARGGAALLHPTGGAFGPAVSITGISQPESTIPVLSDGRPTFDHGHEAARTAPLPHPGSPRWD